MLNWPRSRKLQAVVAIEPEDLGYFYMFALSSLVRDIGYIGSESRAEHSEPADPTRNLENLEMGCPLVELEDLYLKQLQCRAGLAVR